MCHPAARDMHHVLTASFVHASHRPFVQPTPRNPESNAVHRTRRDATWPRSVGREVWGQQSPGRGLATPGSPWVQSGAQAQEACSGESWSGERGILNQVTETRHTPWEAAARVTTAWWHRQKPDRLEKVEGRENLPAPPRGLRH